MPSEAVSQLSAIVQHRVRKLCLCPARTGCHLASGRGDRGGDGRVTTRQGKGEGCVSVRVRISLGTLYRAAWCLSSARQRDIGFRWASMRDHRVRHRQRGRGQLNGSLCAAGHVRPDTYPHCRTAILSRPRLQKRCQHCRSPPLLGNIHPPFSNDMFHISL